MLSGLSHPKQLDKVHFNLKGPCVGWYFLFDFFSFQLLIANSDDPDQMLHYRNDPKFSDRQVWANSADPDQTAPRGAV